MRGMKNSLLTGRGKYRSAYGLADSLQHHVADHNPCTQRIGDELPAQCCRTGSYNSRVSLAEDGKNPRGISHTCHRTNQQKEKAYLHTEPESLAHSGIQPGTIIESAYRLEALPETN